MIIRARYHIDTCPNKLFSKYWFAAHPSPSTLVSWIRLVIVEEDFEISKGRVRPTNHINQLEKVWFLVDGQSPGDDRVPC